MRIDLQNRPSLSRLAPIILLLAFWRAGEGIVRVTRLPVPGPIVGMVLVLGLFASAKVSIGSMRRDALNGFSQKYCCAACRQFLPYASIIAWLYQPRRTEDHGRHPGRYDHHHA